MKILLVDDEDSNLKLLQVLLESESHSVILASNGHEALLRARESMPDLVISDILMPVMDGFALCNAWMKDSRLRNIPFVFYTATYNTEEDEVLGRSLGAAAFLHKPMEPDAFLARVREVLGHACAHLLNPPSAVPLEEQAFMKLYNERLIQKLDQRNAEMSRQLTTLQEAEAQLRLKGAALEAAANGIMITDREGTILWANRSLQAMTGYQEEELLGKNARILKSDVHEPDFYKQLWTTVLSSQLWSREIVNRCKDGTLRIFQNTITPLLDEQGNPLHFISISQDITDQRRAEAEMRQAQKMDAVGRLAGGVAHDFNNMLNIILLDTELLLMQEGLAEAHRKHILEIQDATQRSADLTRQLLVFSRKQPAQPRRIALNEVVSECQKMLHRLIARDVDLVFKPEPGLWNVVMDPSQIHQILVNLVINSRDALAGAGTITLQTANVSLDESIQHLHETLEPGDYVLLSVSDTGSGMDAATLDHIFEPFFTTKCEGKGTGLGLSTVYGIVKQNRGAILAYSQLGLGTTLKIYLPRCQEPLEAQEPEVPPETPRGTETLLLAEDEANILEAMKLALEGQGYKVLAASNPMAARQLAEHHDGPIHLLLTDVVMPGMNGMELQAHIKRSRPYVKVLFMSGYAGGIISQGDQRYEGGHFLQKPFRILDLARKVRETLDS